MTPYENLSDPLPDNWRDTKPCPDCGTRAAHVIYYGLPMWLCDNELCGRLFGMFSFIADWLPFNGYFFVFEGPYPPALWYWLTQPPPGNGDDGLV